MFVNENNELGEEKSWIYLIWHFRVGSKLILSEMARKLVRLSNSFLLRRILSFLFKILYSFGRLKKKECFVWKLFLRAKPMMKLLFW